MGNRQGKKYCTIGSNDFAIFKKFNKLHVFWFGLEILKLVNKKAFFEILNGFYLIWPFILWKKSRVWQKGKRFLQKNWTKFLGTWKICKKAFFCEKIFGNFLMQEYYTFLKSAQNSASFDTLCAQFWRNFLSTLIRDGAISLKVKRSNQIETGQYF